MEPVDPKAIRAKLHLGKFIVVERTELTMKIALGGSTTMTVELPNMFMYDVHEGDMLTFYTEVLLAKPNA